MRIEKVLRTIALCLALAPTAAAAECWGRIGVGGDRVDVRVCGTFESNCVSFCVSSLQWDAVWMQDSLARIVFAVGNYGVANDPSVPSLSGIEQDEVEAVFSQGPISKFEPTSFKGPVVLEPTFCRTCGSPE